MLNQKTNERELCYIVKIKEIRSIPDAEKVELAIVHGWQVLVRKNIFKVGDLAIYFEIDSKVPEKEPFMFLASKDFKIKTQRYFKGTVLSQGLIMSAEDFGWRLSNDTIFTENEEKSFVEGDFLTQELGVTYATVEDNDRKAPSIDKYKKMAQRRPNLFKQPWARWMMKRNWGRKIMFFFFGKKKDKKNEWPAWVKKTDEERCQNLGWLFDGRDTGKWIATEKIDGTSTTFTMRGRKRKREFYICSRNVVFDKPDKKCFYETNVYTEMAEKYDIEKKLSESLDQTPDLDFITVQGETYGAGIQKRDYGLKGHDFMVFNVIFGYKNGEVVRLNPIIMKQWCDGKDLPSVPIVAENFVLPATCDELLEYAASEVSKIDGGMREGVVFRDYNGVQSFKAVSNEFLLEFHQ